MPPKSSSTPKIIIKPLGKRGRGRGRGRDSRSTGRGTVRRNANSTPPSTGSSSENEEIEAQEREEREESEDMDVDMDVDEGGEVASSSQLPSVPQTPGEEEDERQDFDDEDNASGSGEKDKDIANSSDEAAIPTGDAEVSNQSGTEEGADDEEEGVPEVSVKRGRGRPRGRPRGSGTPRTTRGRGRGRGRGKGKGVTIRLPKRGGEDGVEGEEDGTGAEEAVAAGEGEEGGPTGGGRPFRKINGQVYIIDGDAYVTEDDSKGDTKIDINGNLLGGRKFKSQTFSLPNRHPDRQYMLAIDAARTSGFRDSLYYFRKNPLAMKLNATQSEKEHLIEQGKLGSHLRTRSVTLVTARSAFKLHGAKMIVGGRWVTDDYYEDKALAEITAKGLKAGDPVGDLVDPTSHQASAHADDSSKSFLASEKSTISSASGMYRAGGPTTIFGGSGLGPYSDGPLNAVKKSMLNREGLNEENWMLVVAQRAIGMDEEWKKLRRENLKVCGGILDVPGSGGSKRDAGDIVDVGTEENSNKKTKVSDEDGPLPLGIYEPQTGIVLYRSDTQPTTSRWEAVPNSRHILGGTKAGSGAWGLAYVDTVMELSQPHPSSTG